MEYINKIKARFRDWKWRRSMRVVQLVVDGQGADALMLAVTASGRIYSTSLRKMDQWQEVETPLDESERLFWLMQNRATAPTSIGGGQA